MTNTAVVFMAPGVVAGPGAAVAGEKAWSALSSLCRKSLELARSRSPLLHAIDEEAGLEEAGVPFELPLLKRWLAVAAGGDCSADDAVAVLQVASFLQDRETYARLVSMFAGTIAQGFDTSKLEFWSPVRLCGRAYPCSKNTSGPILRMVRSAETGEIEIEYHTIQPCDEGALCLEILEAVYPGAACMDQSTLYHILGALPLGIIARLRQRLQIDAISARVAATATCAPAATANCKDTYTAATTGPESATASAAAGRGPVPYPCTPALVVHDAPECFTTAILFHAALLPPQTLRCISIRCNSEKYPYWPDEEFELKYSGWCKIIRRRPWNCEGKGRALAAALHTHAPSIRRLSLDGLLLARACVRALAEALSISTLRLESLTLGCGLLDMHERPVYEGGVRSTFPLLAAVQLQSALTEIVLVVPGRRPVPVDLSSFPRLRRLELTASARMMEALAAQMKQQRLPGLEALDVHLLASDSDGSASGRSSSFPLHDVITAVPACPRLLTLSVACSAHLMPYEYQRVAHAGLTSLRVRITGHSDTWCMCVPGEELSGFKSLREISITAAARPEMKAYGAKELVKVCCALPALTRLELLCVRVHTTDHCAELTSSLKSLPHLEDLRLMLIAEERSAAPAQMDPDGEATPAYGVTESHRRWLRIFEAERSTAALGRVVEPAAERFRALRVLCLAGNGLSAAQLAVLLDMPRLTHLDLTSNCVGEAGWAPGGDGCRWLVALARLTRLRHVNLAWNGFTEEGALRVLYMLCVLPQLEAVDLRYNDLVSLPARCLLHEAIAKLGGCVGAVCAEQGAAGGPPGAGAAAPGVGCGGCGGGHTSKTVVIAPPWDIWEGLDGLEGP